MSNNVSNILVVEDEMTIAMDLEVRLQKLGYHVAGLASNLDTAINLVEKNNPDIILMDIHLSDSQENGIEIAEVIYSQYKIPIIFVTAYGDKDTFTKALSAKPFGYITKQYRAGFVQSLHSKPN